VVDAGFHRSAQYGQGLGAISGRAEDAGARQLHGPEAHPVDRAAG
jgi:hypothetical protein